MVSSLALSFLLFLMGLCGSGAAVTADNIGDSFADIMSEQLSDYGDELNMFVQNPAMWAFLEETKMDKKLYDEYVAAYGDGTASVPVSTPFSLGLDIANWLSEHSGDVKSTQVGTYAYQVSDDTGKKIVFDWVEERDHLDRQCWVFHQFVYDTNGKLIDDITEHSGSLHSVYDESRVKNIVSNSYYDSDVYCYYVVDNYWSFGINVASYFDGVIAGDNVTEEEPEKPIGQVTVDGVTYTLNPDGSVTIDGTTYYPDADGNINVNDRTYTPTIDFSAYDDTALLDLIRELIGVLTGTKETTSNYDYTGILGSIRALLASLFKSCNTFFDNAKSFFDSRTYTGDLKSELDKTKTALEKKVCLPTIRKNMNTFSTGLFGKRSFNDDGTVYIKSLDDAGDDIVVDKPHLYITVFDKKYDLFASLGAFDSYLPTFKIVVSAFLVIFFVFSVFRGLPNIFMSAAQIGEASFEYNNHSKKG